MKFAEIEPQARRNLLRLAEAYCRGAKIGKAGASPRMTTLSRKASGDHRLFDALKAEERQYQRIGHRVTKKGSVTLRVYDQLIKWFAVNWPPDTAFPELDVLTHNPRENQNGTTEGKHRQETAEGAGKERPEGRGESTGSASGLLARLRDRAG